LYWQLSRSAISTECSGSGSSVNARKRGADTTIH